MAALASVFVEVRPTTDRFEPELKRQIGKVDASASARATGSKWGSAFSKAAGAFAAIGIVQFGKDSVSAFKDAEAAQTRLSNAFEKFPKLADVSLTSLQNLNSELAKKTKFDDDATASGQAVLAQFKLTGTQIAQLTPLLQDYAAKTGKDLPTAATDLGKAMLGQGRSLKAIGINFKDTGSAGGNFREIMSGLRTQVGGFAEKEGKTAAGQSAILSNQFGELQETVGSKLVPILTRLAGALLSVIDFVSRNQRVILPLVAAVGLLAAGLYAVSVATKAWKAAQTAAGAATKVWAAGQWLLNAALSANPIGLVIIAVAGLVAGIIIAYKHSETFRRIVQAAFQAVQAAASATWHWIQKYWPLLLAVLTGPFGLAVLAIVKNWDKVKEAAGVAISFGLTMLGKFLGGLGTVFGFLGKLPGPAGAPFRAAADAMEGARKKVFDMRDGINTALAGIKSHTVTVTAKLSAASQGLSASRAASEFATGGPVFGAGTATSDSIPAMLSNGEHVLTAREVQAFGGHNAVMQMRRSVIRGFAAGGPVALRISPQLSGMDRFEKAIDTFNTRVDAMARKIALASGFAANLTGVVNFARSQAGKPYIWGSAGPGGYDCSGFVSALVNVAQGRRPYSRRFSTGTLPAGLFVPGNGAFNIGWFTGNPGHVAATVNGVPMESRGGDGVVVGAGSRGASQGFFTHHGHLRGFARGGPVLPGDPPWDLLDPHGKYYRRGLMEQLQQATRLYDSGGFLPPGVSVAVNGTGRAERVRTGRQEDRMQRSLDRIAHLLANAPLAYVDDRYVRRQNRYINGRDPSGW